MSTPILFEDTPYAWTLKHSFDQQINYLRICCSFCCKNLPPNKQQTKCSRCEAISYCDNSCMQGDKQWHSAECDAITAAADPGDRDGILEDSSSRLIGRIIARRLVDNGIPPIDDDSSWKKYGLRNLNELVSHATDIANHNEAEELFQETWEDFKKTFENVPRILEAINEGDFRQIYGKIKTNSFSLSQYDLDFGAISIGVALYLNSSRFDHDCNAEMTFWNDGKKMFFQKVRPIEIQDIIGLHVNYVGSGIGCFGLATTHERRQQLQDGYWFRCFCQWCADENRDLIQKWSVEQPCPICTDGVMVIKNTVIECIQCDHVEFQSTLEIKEIQEIVHKIDEICQDFNEVISEESEDDLSDFGEEECDYRNLRSMLAKMTSVLEAMTMVRSVEQLLHPVHNIYLLRLRELLFEYYRQRAEKEENEIRRSNLALAAVQHGEAILQSYDKHLPSYSLWKATHCYHLFRMHLAAGSDKPPMLRCLKVANRIWKAHSPPGHPCRLQIEQHILQLVEQSEIASIGVDSSTAEEI